MEIRNYKNTDYSQIASILKEAGLFDEVWDSEDSLSGMVAKDPEAILVAEKNGVIVGSVFIIPYGNKISYLFRLAVKKEFRKQGIASELLKRAKEIAKQRGVLEVGLYVESGNSSLQDFYKKRGFSISEKSYNYMWEELK